MPWRWEVVESAPPEVKAALEKLERSELAGEVVKSNPKRDVIRVGDLYVKRYRVTSRFERWKHVFVPSKARQEHEVMAFLRSKGVATAEPLAWGERRALFLDESAFVSRAVPGARSFARVLDAARAGEGDREELIRKLARLACAIAKAGADHRDLHVGNVLLDAEGRATIIDLHAVSLDYFGARASFFERLARLALSLGALEEERAHFGREEVVWLADEAARAENSVYEHAPRAGELAEALEARAQELLATHLRSRDKRCLKDSKTFAVEGTRGRRVYRRRDFAELDRLLAAKGDQVLHEHARGRSTIERVGAFVRKTERYPSLGSRLGALLRGSRARDAWKGARALEVRQLPHARALALVEERGLVFPARSYLLMEHLEGTWMVHVYLEKVLGKGEPRKRRALARALGALVARLHARGVIHRDLAVQNVLLREKGGGFELWFVDLDEVRVREPSEEDALRALVQVADLPRAASRSDLLRGLRAYLGEGGAPAIQALVAREGEGRLVARISSALVQRARDKARRQERKMRATT